MTKKINIQDKLLKRVGEIADGVSTQAYVVGGFVRDLLLGKQVRDIDVVVMGDGISFARHVAEALGKTNLVVFENFGTAMLQLEQSKLEFVGARKESYSKFSRKPKVEWGTLDDDLSRRDFTVNAMAVSLNAADFGSLVDPFQGQEAMREKILCTPLDPIANIRR